MIDKLYCHTPLVFGQEVIITVGSVYPIIGECDDYYRIMTDDNMEHIFTKHEDEYGESYKNWFSVEEVEPLDTKESETVVLLVHGDGDYEAMYFEQEFDAGKVYAEMLAEGVTKKTLTVDRGYGDEDIYVSIHNFGEVDEKFVNFLVEEFMDYDHMKAKNFHIV